MPLVPSLIPLGAFLVRRASLALAGAIAVASLTMVVGLHTPGDHVTQALGLGAGDGVIARARAVRGLDAPPHVQFGRWFAGLARLDLGSSVLYQRPVTPLVTERTWNTVLLALAALALAAAIGLPLGIISGSRGGLASSLIRMTSLVCVSVPPLLGSLLLVWLAARLDMLPVAGGRPSPGANGLSTLSVFVVPMLALALPVAAAFERLQAEAVRRALAEPCMLAALARGVSRKRLIWNHATRLGAGSVLSVGGILAGAVLSGSVAVELVTSWPGLGRLSYDAFVARDLQLAAACAGMAALVLAAGVTASDLTLALIDPRARFDDAASGPGTPR